MFLIDVNGAYVGDFYPLFNPESLAAKPFVEHHAFAPGNDEIVERFSSFNLPLLDPHRFELDGYGSLKGQ